MAFTKGNKLGKGRKKGSKNEAALRDACRGHADEVLKRMMQVVRGSDDAAAVRAGTFIWERAYGRPTQAIEGTPNGPPIAVSIRWEQPS